MYWSEQSFTGLEPVLIVRKSKELKPKKRQLVSKDILFFFRTSADINHETIRFDENDNILLAFIYSANPVSLTPNKGTSRLLLTLHIPCHDKFPVYHIYITFSLDLFCWPLTERKGKIIHV
jgi:hypothetical protein